MHTSGHADLKTLKTLFETVKPNYGVIPIHTEGPEKFQDFFHELTPIIPLNDGDVYDCDMQLVEKC
jgi:mRNA degradation ribonuclease J1/J2